MSGLGVQHSNYQLFTIDLTAAGSQTVSLEGDFLHFIDAVKAGAVDLDAKVSIKLGSAVDDLIPFRLNSHLEGYFARLTFSWDAQPGTLASFLVSREMGRGDRIRTTTPPTKQLVTTSVGSAVEGAAVSVGTSATLLDAADSTRQSVTLKNAGAVTVYVGPSGVTTTNGLPLEPGEALTVDKTTAALYAIVASGSCDVRVFVENG